MVCAICGDQSSHPRVTITPAQYRTKSVVGSDGRPLTAKEVISPAVVVNLCAKHYHSHLEQQGWQEREEEKRKRNTRAAKERLKRDQIPLW